MKNKSVEFEGNTLEDAIQKAVKKLGVERERLKIEILSEEKKGLFGMPGEKPAKIRAAVISEKK